MAFIGSILYYFLVVNAGYTGLALTAGVGAAGGVAGYAIGRRRRSRTSSSEWWDRLAKMPEDDLNALLEQYNRDCDDSGCKPIRCDGDYVLTEWERCYLVTYCQWREKNAK